MRFIYLTAAFAASAFAAPTKTSALDTRAFTTEDWSAGLANFYTAVDKHIRVARQASSFPSPPSCDLSQASMPTAPTPLPSPANNSYLKHVAIGRGTQNYTCAGNTSASTPVPIGAVATLFNASCVAAMYPDLLTMLPSLALEYPVPAETLSPSNIALSGHHFFRDTTTPIFNMDTSTTAEYGYVVGKKNASSVAPADAVVGQNNEGYGAVAWLYLLAQNGTTDQLQNVYRLNTAGGSPPTTCEGQESVFEIQYAAEYWFWAQ